MILFRRGSTHELDDRRLGAELIGWLEAETGGKGWFAIILRSDGRWHHKLSPPAIVAGWAGRPDFVEKRAYLVRLVHQLNDPGDRGALVWPGTQWCRPGGGAWVGAWVDDMRSAWVAWKDDDGDVRTYMILDDAWERVRATSIDKWVEDAIAALRKCWLIERQMSPTPDQLYSPALGQKPPRLS